MGHKNTKTTESMSLMALCSSFNMLRERRTKGWLLELRTVVNSKVVLSMKVQKQISIVSVVTHF